LFEDRHARSPFNLLCNLRPICTRYLALDQFFWISGRIGWFGREAGSAILYGIEFDTGTSVTRPSSIAALQVVANVLQSRPGNYYIVGHTDDTGAFDFNMALSRDRAASVVAALTGDYSIDPARLQPGGVGPMAPVASNDTEAGRQLNRRVELVRRLGE
jgi:OmpA-OmpF porin, OOP family